MGDQIDYVKLTLAIAGGIVLASLVLWLASLVLAVGLFSAITSGLQLTFDSTPSSSVTAGADYQRQLAKEKRQQRADQQQQQPQPRHQPQSTLSAIERRKRSPMGRRLFVECDVWQRNYDKTPTRTTRQYRDRHCKGYREYIRTGRAPVLETR